VSCSRVDVIKRVSGPLLLADLYLQRAKITCALCLVITLKPFLTRVIYIFLFSYIIFDIITKFI